MADIAVKVERIPERILFPSDPMRSARALLDDLKEVQHQNGAFYLWEKSNWREVDEAEIRAKTYLFLEQARKPKGESTEPFRPTKSRVADVLDALKGVTNLPRTYAAPCWLDDRKDPPAHEIMACENGLLHLKTMRLLPCTPKYFNLSALPFDFNVKAAPPVEWLRFLNTLWRDDPESIAALQEIFGLLLTPDTTQQKIFLIVGPKRAGKGTIARILRALLGQDNVAGPTLNSLGQNFGLQALIGKQAAIISDARLGGRTDQHTIAERLLSISGEDALTIDRKFKEPWTGQIGARFLIMTNELPRIADASGALASRFIVLTLKESFYGKEDPGLTDRLRQELPGILNWAIEGWQRLHERGHFIQPSSAQEAIAELEDLGSPISAFLRDTCTIGPEHEVPCAEIFTAWKAWCEAQNREHPGTMQSFGRDLRAAITGLQVINRRTGEKRERVYQGLTLGGTQWNAIPTIAHDRDSESYTHNAVDRVPSRSTWGGEL